MRTPTPSRSSVRLVAATVLSCLLAGCRATAPDEVAGDREERSAADEAAGMAFELALEARVDNVPERASNLRLWVPVPADTHDQRIDGVHASGIAGNSLFELDPQVFETERASGTSGGVAWTLAPLGNGDGRSLCLETGGRPLGVTLRVRVTRLESSVGGAATEKELARARAVDSTGPTASGDRALVEAAAGLPAGDDPLLTARALYDLVLDRTRPLPTGQAGEGPDDDPARTFVRLARARGIAARTVTGLLVPPTAGGRVRIDGAHTWAQFWVQGRGWVPIDPEAAARDPHRAEAFFGRLDIGRVTLTSGSDLVLEPRQAQASVDRFAYPVCEIDGQPFSDVATAFGRLE